MNKIHKIACLIGMMILLNHNAFAMGHGSGGGMLLDLIAEMFKMSLIGSLTELYLVLHFIYIIHGIKLWRNKENIINWNEVRTNFRIRRSKPEPDKFIDAEFPQPVMWYGIPIKRIERQLTGNQKWANIIITTQPAQTFAIGQWLCDKNHSLDWLLQKESVDRISYHQSAEPYVYLYRCFLKDGQVVSLPAFQATLPAEALVRKNDPLTDVEQGLWLVLINRFDKEKVSQAMNMDFSVFDIMTDSQKVIHDFLIQLNNAPERHCGLPQNIVNSI